MPKEMERDMGNEDKVTQFVDTRAIFLPEDLHSESGPTVYSLGDEFAKTGKNTNIPFYIAVLGFIAVLALSAVIITRYVQYRSSIVAIDISEFEDLKLRDILDSASKFKTDLNVAREELDEFRLKIQTAILDVKDAATKKREAILSRHLDSDQTEAELKKINEEEAQQIKAVTAQYNRKITQKQKDISELKLKISAFDGQVKDRVGKAEDIISNYQKLHTMKMEKQRAYYENEIRVINNYNKRYIESLVLKYNPIFRSGEFDRILNTKIDTDKKKIPVLKEYMPELRREGVMTEPAFTALRSKISDNFLIMNRMNRIPYENSVPSALTHNDYFTRLIISDYENLWSSLVGVIGKKNRQLQYYRNAFNSLSKIDPECGFIVDPADPKMIRVHLSPIHSIKEGDTGLIFRRDDEYVGKIEFFMTPEGMAAKAVDVDRNKKIEPFDKILFKIK
jgi:hypothetical protein